jgi:hypothetical protein
MQRGLNNKACTGQEDPHSHLTTHPTHTHVRARKTPLGRGQPRGQCPLLVSTRCGRLGAAAHGGAEVDDMLGLWFRVGLAGGARAGRRGRKAQEAVWPRRGNVRRDQGARAGGTARGWARA